MKVQYHVYSTLCWISDAMPKCCNHEILLTVMPKATALDKTFTYLGLTATKLPSATKVLNSSLKDSGSLSTNLDIASQFSHARQ